MESNKIQSVCGTISPSKIGITLTHEHLNHQFNNEMLKPLCKGQDCERFSTLNCDLNNLWWINYHPYSNVDNMRFNDDECKNALQEEMKYYHLNGGRTIVENSTFERDLNYLRNLSSKSGVNIITGTGYYVASGQPASVLALTTEAMYNSMQNDLIKGNLGIKCGFIGEIGTSFPLDSFERRSLIASGQLQEQLKCPVMIHPARHHQSPFEDVRILLEAGGNARKMVMAHLERTLVNDEELLEFAKMGTFCEFDLFGAEISYYELSDDLDMPNDAVRIKRLKLLIKEGFLDKILISHDIHTKHRLMKFGGHGFSHILRNTIPKMINRGYSQQQIDQIMIENPKNWLTVG